MIKNIFIPEKIGNYYLFAQRIIGFDIGKTHISATQVFINGRVSTIEKVMHIPLPSGSGDYEEKVSQGIKEILAGMDRYDAIYSALSSSVVVFKELTLPFTTREKIELVISYEVESLLPFTLDQAVVDFIITKTTETHSDVLVAAVQKQHIAEHISLFEAAGVEVSKIVVDLFSLYGLMQLIEHYSSFSGAQVVLNLGFSATRLAYIRDGQLKFIRTIPQGISTIIKNMSNQLSIPASEIHETIMRLGFETVEDNAFEQQASRAFSEYLNTVQFTLQSFQERAESSHVRRIVLLGGGAEIKNIAPFIEKKLSIPTELFSLQTLDSEHIRYKYKMAIPFNSIISMSVALPTKINENFNLRKNEFSLIDENLFTKQVVVATTLIVCIFLLFIGNSFLQIRKLNKTIEQGEKEAISLVSNTLNVSSKNLNSLVSDAQTSVLDQDRIWFSFSQQTRSSFLASLQKLTTAIDKDSIGLKLKKLRFTHDAIRLQGEVKDIPALVILEDELKEANLGTFSAAQEPKFDITITLKKSSED